MTTPPKPLPLPPSTGSAHNKLTLKWGTLKVWDVKTPEAVSLLKAYHEEPVSYSVMMQRDTPNQKETLIKLIDLCDEIWLDWEGKQVSRDEAKEYLRTYGQNSVHAQEEAVDLALYLEKLIQEKSET